MKTTDKPFIIDLALNQFNRQHNTSLRPIDMDARTIPHGELYDAAYEVFTAISSDNIRLKMYFNVDDDTTGISKFRYLSGGRDPLTSSVDTTYVATGSIDEHYVWSSIVDLKDIDIDIDKVGGLLLESGIPFLLESNKNLLLESNTHN